MEIIPAIIPKNFDDLKKKVSIVEKFSPFVQIDITDGVFVGSKSWPFNDDMWLSGVCVELPQCHSCGFELDMMVTNPEERVGDWLGIGAKRIIIHAETTKNLEKVLDEMKGKVEIGLAFDIDTPIKNYEKALGMVDFVQLMGIEKLGYQGEPFSRKVFEKIKELRSVKPEMTISIDGGVSLENAQELVNSGVTRLVAGSAIFSSESPEETINKFKSLKPKNCSCI